MIASPLRRIIVQNTLAQVLAKAIGAAATFGITVVIAQRFGPSGYGDFIKITTYVAFFYLLVDFGINAVFLQKDSPFGVLLGLRLIFSVILAGVAMGLLFLLPQGTSQGYTPFVRMGIILFIPSIFFQSLTTTANALFQKHLRYDRATIGVAAGSLVALLSVWFLAAGTVQDKGIVFSVVALLAGSAVTAVVSLLLGQPFRIGDHISFDKQKLWSLFQASIPLGVTLVFNLVYFRIDSVFLTLTRETNEVGFYGLAYKIFELPLVFPTFFMNAVYPIMLRGMKGNDPHGYMRRMLFRAFVLLCASSLFLLLVFWMAAPLLVFIRSEFVMSIPAVRVLSLGLPFFFLSSLTMWGLIALRKQVLLAALYGGIMVLTIFLDALLIPPYGYMAAAWITVASEGIILLASGLFLVHALWFDRKDKK